MKQLEMLYEGKAKQVFRTDDPDKIIIHYKDAATAFNISFGIILHLKNSKITFQS